MSLIFNYYFQLSFNCITFPQFSSLGRSFSSSSSSSSLFSLHHFSVGLCLLPIISSVPCPVPARWHLPRWGCGMMSFLTVASQEEWGRPAGPFQSLWGTVVRTTISWLIRSCQEAEQHQSPFLDNGGERWLFTYSPHFKTACTLIPAYIKLIFGNSSSRTLYSLDAKPAATF